MDLNKVTLGVSPITGEIYLYRFGKNQNEALDKRKAEPDLMFAFAQHMMHDAPTGSSKVINFDGKRYEVICKPLDET